MTETGSGGELLHDLEASPLTAVRRAPRDVIGLTLGHFSSG